MYLCILYSQDNNIKINIFYETLTTLLVAFTDEIFDIKGYVFFDRIAWNCTHIFVNKFPSPFKKNNIHIVFFAEMVWF